MGYVPQNLQHTVVLEYLLAVHVASLRWLCAARVEEYEVYFASFTAHDPRMKAIPQDIKDFKIIFGRSYGTQPAHKGYSR